MISRIDTMHDYLRIVIFAFIAIYKNCDFQKQQDYKNRRETTVKEKLIFGNSTLNFPFSSSELACLLCPQICC